MHRRECPACGKLKSQWKGRHKNWICCSKECGEKFFCGEATILNWQETRLEAFKRDHYTCRRCGRHGSYMLNGNEIFDAGLLVGDHIVPIALGGPEFDLDNVQTLCIQCNKIKTREDQAKIALARRAEKMKTAPTKQRILEVFS